jgi:FdhD protein
MRKGKTGEFEIVKVRGGRAAPRYDELATEEPLEIRVCYDSEGVEQKSSVSVTMRTPGNDFELAAGFLLTEGIISGQDDIDRISYCTDPKEEQQYNIVNVYLSPSFRFDPSSLRRNFYMSSSCGVCGRASIEGLQGRGCRVPLASSGFTLRHQVIEGLPASLRSAQAVFEKTGGLHASGLFDSEGKLRVIREDVGRHNALDKVIGSELLANRLPLSDSILAVSGRTSYELVQKALVGGIPAIVAVGAPSSLAVELAREFGLTLVGFVREGSFNVYSDPKGLVAKEPEQQRATAA